MSVDDVSGEREKGGEWKYRRMSGLRRRRQRVEGQDPRVRLIYICHIVSSRTGPDIQ